MTSSHRLKSGVSALKKKKMAHTKIQYQSSCPYGHEEIDFVDLVHRKYVFEYNVLGSPSQKIGNFTGQQKLERWSA